MNPVAFRRSRHTIIVVVFIGLFVLVAACTRNDGPSAPTVAPTLAVVSRVTTA